MSMIAKPKVDKATLQRRLEAHNLPVTGNIATLKMRLEAAERGISPPDPVDEKQLSKFESGAAVARRVTAKIAPIESEDDVRKVDAALSKIVNPAIDEIGEVFDQNVINWEVLTCMTRNFTQQAKDTRAKYLDPYLECKRQMTEGVGEFQNRKRLKAIEEHKAREREIQSMTVDALEEEIIKLSEEGNEEEAERLYEEMESRAAEEVEVIQPKQLKRELVDSTETTTVFIPDRELIQRQLDFYPIDILLREKSDIEQLIGGIEIVVSVSFKVVDIKAVRDEFKRPSVRSSTRRR